MACKLPLETESPPATPPQRDCNLIGFFFSVSIFVNWLAVRLGSARIITSTFVRGCAPLGGSPAAIGPEGTTGKEAGAPGLSRLGKCGERWLGGSSCLHIWVADLGACTVLRRLRTGPTPGYPRGPLYSGPEALCGGCPWRSPAEARPLLTDGSQPPSQPLTWEGALLEGVDHSCGCKSEVSPFWTWFPVTWRQAPGPQSTQRTSPCC